MCLCVHLLATSLSVAASNKQSFCASVTRSKMPTFAKMPQNEFGGFRQKVQRGVEPNSEQHFTPGLHMLRGEKGLDALCSKTGVSWVHRLCRAPVCVSMAWMVAKVLQSDALLASKAPCGYCHATHGWFFAPDRAEVLGHRDLAKIVVPPATHLAIRSARRAGVTAT